MGARTDRPGRGVPGARTPGRAPRGCVPVGTRHRPSEPDWPVVYIETEAGQLSWYIAPGDAPLFTHARRSDSAVWDGHTTEQKYARLDNLTRTIAAREGS